MVYVEFITYNRPGLKMLEDPDLVRPDRDEEAGNRPARQHDLVSGAERTFDRVIRVIRSGAVGVTSVIDVEDVDGVGVIVDRIADAVLAAPGSPLSLERLAQGDAHSARLFAEGAANELETCPRDGFG